MYGFLFGLCLVLAYLYFAIRVVIFFRKEEDVPCWHEIIFPLIIGGIVAVGIGMICMKTCLPNYTYQDFVKTSKYGYFLKRTIIQSSKYNHAVDREGCQYYVENIGPKEKTVVDVFSRGLLEEPDKFYCFNSTKNDAWFYFLSAYRIKSIHLEIETGN